MELSLKPIDRALNKKLLHIFVNSSNNSWLTRFSSVSVESWRKEAQFHEQTSIAWKLESVF